MIKGLHLAGGTIANPRTFSPTSAQVSRAALIAPGVAAFAGVLGLAMSGGGYGGAASGAMTALVWSALLVASIALPGQRRHLPLAASAAVLLLGTPAVLALISIGWSATPGAAFEEATRVAGYVGVLVMVVLAGFGRREVGRSMLVGLAVAIVVVALLAVGSRLLGIGAGDAEIVAAYPGSAGRLSWPIGYWNGLGALMAMGVPLLAWLGAGPRRGALWVAALVPVLLAGWMTGSRGAALAALLGVLVLVGLAAGSRRRLSASILASILASIPAVLAAQLGDGILTEPFRGIGTPEVVAAALLGVATVAAGLLVTPARALLRRPRLPDRTLPLASALLAAVLVVAIFVVGPGAIAEEFTSISRDGGATVGSDGGIVLSASGSGRAQFWEVALNAFVSEPLRGIGAGGFESFWSREGDLGFVIRSAHSEPLELLAELGVLAALTFLAFFAVVLAEGVRRRRPAGQDREGAEVPVAAVCLALLAAGSIGLLIDWSWDIPAVVVPILIASGILLTGRTGRTPARAAYEGRAGSAIALPAPLLAAGAIIIALPIISAGFVSGVGSAQLDRAEESYQRGRLDQAVAAARTAARLQPWSADPWRRIAVSERAAGNEQAALRAVQIALRKAPESFELWGLAAQLSASAGAEGAAMAYAERGRQLAPATYSATFGAPPGSSARR